MATIRSRLATVARCVVACALAAAWSLPVHAGSISPSDIKIEIVDSLAWLDSKNDPYVSLRLSLMTPMQQTVMNSRPYVRITNQSTQSDVFRFDLNLSQTPSIVKDVEWISVPGKVGWGWDNPNRTANLNFYDPIQPGKSATMRLTTGAFETATDTYALIQNYFAPTSALSDKYGVLEVYAAPTGTVKDLVVDSNGNIVAPISMPPITYNLQDYPVDYYNTSTFLNGSIGMTIEAVPEPSSLALLGAAAVMGLLGRGRRRVA